MPEYRLCGYRLCPNIFRAEDHPIKSSPSKMYCTISCRSRANEKRRRKPRFKIKSQPGHIMRHRDGTYCAECDQLHTTHEMPRDLYPKVCRCGGNLHITPMDDGIFEVWCEECGTEWRSK
jgi:hypothetical protein